MSSDIIVKVECPIEGTKRINLKHVTHIESNEGGIIVHMYCNSIFIANPMLAERFLKYYDSFMGLSATVEL